jgi:hypothetical protein
MPKRKVIDRHCLRCKKECKKGGVLDHDNDWFGRTAKSLVCKDCETLDLDKCTKCNESNQPLCHSISKRLYLAKRQTELEDVFESICYQPFECWKCVGQSHISQLSDDIDEVWALKKKLAMWKQVDNEIWPNG